MHLGIRYQERNPLGLRETYQYGMCPRHQVFRCTNLRPPKVDNCSRRLIPAQVYTLLRQGPGWFVALNGAAEWVNQLPVRRCGRFWEGGRLLAKLTGFCIDGAEQDGMESELSPRKPRQNAQKKLYMYALYLDTMGLERFQVLDKVYEAEIAIKRYCGKSMDC